MLPLDLYLGNKKAPRILCLGAHSDDIEIGASATILKLAEQYPSAHVDWVVFGASGIREQEAVASANHCTRGYQGATVRIHAYRDGHFPMEATAIKAEFENIKSLGNPDLVFTHYRHDRHQDHALISDLTWQTFRNHLIFEYEVPKYDGDMGNPNVFSSVSKALVEQKLEVLERFFTSQQQKSWFDPETFSALMRLRGVECHADSGFAEAFYCRKMLLRST